jgi:hypothetical protein
LIQIKLSLVVGVEDVVMPPFLYRCPNTSYRVQGFVAEEIPAEGDIYEAVTCLACRRIHLVNPATGKLLGERDE